MQRSASQRTASSCRHTSTAPRSQRPRAPGGRSASASASIAAWGGDGRTDHPAWGAKWHSPHCRGARPERQRPSRRRRARGRAARPRARAGARENSSPCGTERRPPATQGGLSARRRSSCVAAPSQRSLHPQRVCCRIRPRAGTEHVPDDHGAMIRQPEQHLGGPRGLDRLDRGRIPGAEHPSPESRDVAAASPNAPAPRSEALRRRPRPGRASRPSGARDLQPRAREAARADRRARGRRLSRPRPRRRPRATPRARRSSGAARVRSRRPRPCREATGFSGRGPRQMALAACAIWPGAPTAAATRRPTCCSLRYVRPEAPRRQRGCGRGR